MAQLYEFIVSSGQVFSGLTAGNGQPNATIYVLPGGEIIDTVVFSSGWDVLSANTVVIGVPRGTGRLSVSGQGRRLPASRRRGRPARRPSCRRAGDRGR